MNVARSPAYSRHRQSPAATTNSVRYSSRPRICGETNDENGRGGEEKERKNEAEMDGQCNLKSMDLREKGLPGEETHNRDAWSETLTPHAKDTFANIECYRSAINM